MSKATSLRLISYKSYVCDQKLAVFSVLKGYKIEIKYALSVS